VTEQQLDATHVGAGFQQVRGLFAEQEQATVLDLLERSVVFLTPDTIETVLLTTPWLRTVWDLANLYLLSCGAKPLSKDARHIVGLSAETTCFVAMDYFSESSRFDDFVVHEAAHVEAGLLLHGGPRPMPYYTRSNTAAMPCPPPMHIVTSA
jgi:hypothetical protein